MFVSLFRLPDDLIHVVIAARQKIKRNGTYLTVCQQLVEDDAIRVVPHHDHLKAPVISCDTCLEATVI